MEYVLAALAFGIPTGLAVWSLISAIRESA
jgi:hypothetical protein